LSTHNLVFGNLQVNGKLQLPALTFVTDAAANGVFTRSSKRPANFQQMYSKYTC